MSLYNILFLLFFFFFFLFTPINAKSDSAITGRNGKINTIVFNNGDDQIQIQTDVHIPLHDWNGNPGLNQAKDIKIIEKDNNQTWSGWIEVEKGKKCLFKQTIEAKNGGIDISLQMTALSDLNIEGIYFSIKVPVDIFKGGECEFHNQNKLVKKAFMPRTMPTKFRFLSASSTQMKINDSCSNICLTTTFDKECRILIEDLRQWGISDYGALIFFHSGQLAHGHQASMKISLKLESQFDFLPANLNINPSRQLYQFTGFGGTYCYYIYRYRRIADYTLNNLLVSWSRTKMTLAEWEPKNDNAYPSETNWDCFCIRDYPKSIIRREFLFAQKLQKRGIPFSITVFRIPEWLQAKQGRGPKAKKTKVAPDKWSELLECIGSYLIYAKDKYGIEPDLFSFNEPNAGAFVLFSPEEHCKAIKLIGDHFKKLGLKTKMLLADVNGPREKQFVYAQKAAKDPEALKHIGAIAFHSWGGATKERYNAWSGLAHRLKLPLFVTEFGVDASEWRYRSYDFNYSYIYGLQEVRMYQELLLYAHPQVLMYWELRSKAFIQEKEKLINKTIKLSPTKRLIFLKHFCNLTPKNSYALETKSDHPKILFTAFAGDNSGNKTYTLHIANLGGSREAVISGLPSELTELQIVQTNKYDDFRYLAQAPVIKGVVQIELSPLSLVTLTTMPIESKNSLRQLDAGTEGPSKNNFKF